MDNKENSNHEHFNVVSSLIGAVVAIPAVIALLIPALRQGDQWKIISFSIYGITLVALYLFSTLYHGSNGRMKPIFRALDHCAIYLLIAGTYTPFMLITLKGVWGWSLLVAVWGLAVIGILLDLLKRKGPRIVQVILYLVMGWLVVLAMGPLMKALPLGGVVLLVSGGLFYTLGVILFALDRRFPYAHGIWHLFVLAGSTGHWLTVYLYLAQ